MKSYLVITPEYEIHSASWYEPPEYGSDVIEIEAVNAEDAKAFGVKLMLQDISPVPNISFGWCKSQRLSGESPYTGVKVEEYLLGDDEYGKQ